MTLHPLIASFALFAVACELPGKNIGDPIVGEESTGEASGTDGQGSSDSTTGGSSETSGPSQTASSTNTTEEQTATSQTSGTSATTDSQETSGGPAGDGCAFIVGKKFLSDEELECGLGPNGVELCHWSVSFTADEFMYLHSDLGEGSDYSCQDNVITTGIYVGTVDPDAGTLTWDGNSYTVEP